MFSCDLDVLEHQSRQGVQKVFTGLMRKDIFDIGDKEPSDTDRQVYLEHNDNSHSTAKRIHLTAEQICLHSIGDVWSAFFKSFSEFKVDCPNLVHR